MNLYEVEYYYEMGGNIFAPGHATIEAPSEEEARQIVVNNLNPGSKLYVSTARRLDEFTVVHAKN